MLKLSIMQLSVHSVTSRYDMKVALPSVGVNSTHRLPLLTWNFLIAPTVCISCRILKFLGLLFFTVDLWTMPTLSRLVVQTVIKTSHWPKSILENGATESFFPRLFCFFVSRTGRTAGPISTKIATLARFRPRMCLLGVSMITNHV